MDGAIDRALTFLMASRHRNDLWYDFQLAPGWSDEWVSGYVGDRIGGVEGTASAISAAWTTLARRTHVRRAGWGYNAVVPQDADSTSWVLRLATLAGAENSVEAQRGLASLAAFRHANGLLGTYGPVEEIRAFIGADAVRSFRGWTAPHACVTAAAAPLTGIIDASSLLGAQRPDGAWRSYWWPSDSFATALATEALGPCSASALAAQWVAASPWQSGTAFDLSNDAITFLSARTHATLAADIIGHLLDTQADDGSWAPGAVMRVPDPGDDSPWEERTWKQDGRIEGAVVRDTRGVFTTATVVRALYLYQAQEDVDE